MKQIIQSVKNGKTELIDVPVPYLPSGHILIKTTRSLVSLGTERMLVEFGRSSIIQKIKKRPEQVKVAINKLKTDGVLSTLKLVNDKLDQDFPLGYCNVGIVVESRSNQFQIGDRVASNGNHAEMVAIPENLATHIPSSVDDDSASFTVIGAIGLQGIRLIDPTFGETIIVVGLGLVGLITAQLLKANGVNVIGVDVDDEKCSLCESFGITAINSSNQDAVKMILNITGNIGCDGVLITASTPSNKVISESAKMSRKRGRIVLVGVVGLDIDRNDFYEKELTFQVSCSYGPGRYDEKYERNGQDYPIAFVRWTEKRNFETILNAIDNHNLNVKPLITKKVLLENFNDVYDNLNSENNIASILCYSDSDKSQNNSNIIDLNDNSFKGSTEIIGVIGAGNFVQSVILPELNKLKVGIKYIASAGGISGTKLAKKYGINKSTTDYKEIINDAETNVVIITTRHDTHAKIVVEALKKGKNIFVEKPLAINDQELDSIIEQLNEKNGSNLMVGFNRRFSPHLQYVKNSIGPTNLINLSLTMNAGHIPETHWVQDMKIGGGRIVGEACHFIDVCVFITGSLVDSVCVNSLGLDYKLNSDNVSILLKFKNGSNASINYFSNGSREYNKEKIEVFSQGMIWVVDNFQTTRTYGVKGGKKIKTKVDKGHTNQFYEFFNRVKKGGAPLIPIKEIINVTKASFAILESLKTKSWVSVR